MDTSIRELCICSKVGTPSGHAIPWSLGHIAVQRRKTGIGVQTVNRNERSHEVSKVGHTMSVLLFQWFLFKEKVFKAYRISPVSIAKRLSLLVVCLQILEPMLSRHGRQCKAAVCFEMSLFGHYSSVIQPGQARSRVLDRYVPDPSRLCWIWLAERGVVCMGLQCEKQSQCQNASPVQKRK